jgi:hypothetical protein
MTLCDLCFEKATVKRFYKTPSTYVFCPNHAQGFKIGILEEIPLDQDQEGVGKN